MKVLVTGGAGYVGSVLIPELLNKNYKVCVVDNLMYDNGHTIIPYFKTPKFKFIKGDARDESLMKDLIPNFEFVIHLAAIVGFPACRKSRFSQNSKRRFFKINIFSTFKRSGDCICFNWLQLWHY